MAVRASQNSLVVFTTRSSNARVSQNALIVFYPFIPMSINYPLSPPSIAGLGPQDVTFTEVNVVGETESPFSLNQNIQQWSGQQLQIEANLPPMLLAQAELWMAFLGSLFGKTGTFLMGDYNRPTPQGVMSGSPLSSGFNPAGLNQLTIRGAALGVTNWAVAGDYIQLTASGFPQRIYKVLQNASSDGAGNVTLSIFPNTREAIPDGTAIITTNCQGTFRLQENSFRWKTDKDRKYIISFKAKEAM